MNNSIFDLNLPLKRLPRRKEMMALAFLRYATMDDCHNTNYFHPSIVIYSMYFSNKQWAVA